MSVDMIVSVLIVFSIHITTTVSSLILFARVQKIHSETLTENEKLSLYKIRKEAYRPLLIGTIIFIILTTVWLLTVVNPRFISVLEFWMPFGFITLGILYLIHLAFVISHIFRKMKEMQIAVSTLPTQRNAFWLAWSGFVLILLWIPWYVLRIRQLI